MRRYLPALAALLLTVLTLTLVSCNQGRGNHERLRENDWTLLQITLRDKEAVETAPDGIYISFSDSSRVSGRGGCNTFFGRYQTMGYNQLVIDQLGGTLMFCINQQFEDRFMEELRKVVSYDIEDGKLILTTADYQSELVFRPKTTQDDQIRIDNLENLPGGMLPPDFPTGNN